MFLFEARWLQDADVTFVNAVEEIKNQDSIRLGLEIKGAYIASLNFTTRSTIGELLVRWVWYAGCVSGRGRRNPSPRE